METYCLREISNVLKLLSSRVRRCFWCEDFPNIIWHYLFSRNGGGVFSTNWWCDMILEENIRWGCNLYHKLSSSLLYTFSPVYCSLSKIILYLKFRMKTFGCAAWDHWRTFFVNIMLWTVIINQDYCLLFDFVFFKRSEYQSKYA